MPLLPVAHPSVYMPCKVVTELRYNVSRFDVGEVESLVCKGEEDVTGSK